MLLDVEWLRSGIYYSVKYIVLTITMKKVIA